MFDICPMLVEKISDNASEGLSILLRDVHFMEEFDHRQFLALGLSWKAGLGLKEQKVRIFDRSAFLLVYFRFLNIHLNFTYIEIV